VLLCTSGSVNFLYVVMPLVSLFFFILFVVTLFVSLSTLFDCNKLCACTDALPISYNVASSELSLGSLHSLHLAFSALR
jgi:hypothetical protein